MKILFTLLYAILFCSAHGASALVVLQYHHVSEVTPKSTSIAPALFQQHLDYLAEQDFAVLSLPEVLKMLHTEEALPDRAVLITFDDGYLSIYSEAWPRLKKLGWPFAVFVNSQPHDERQASHMSWEQLRELKASGATIVNHSRGHPYFLRLDLQAEHAYEQEIEYAQKRIEKEMGAAPKAFAYPYGEYDQAMQNTLREHNYLAFGQHSGAVAEDVNRQLVPRFPFGGSYGDMDDFKQKVNSLAIKGVKTESLSEKGERLIDPALPQEVLRPVWQVRLPETARALVFNCFASGQGAIPVEKTEDGFSTQAKKPLPQGRSRYNCTASNGEGRFYWLSELYIRRAEDGQWRHQ